MESWSKKRLKYAKRIVKQGMKNPFYTMTSVITEKGVNILLRNSDGELSNLSGCAGYYCIYREKNKKLECLYVGKTDSSLQNRIHRWAKGVAGKLRPDENHAAATKARLDGVKLSDKIMIKTIEMDEVNRLVDDKFIRSEPLDEWIAPLLKSKYNVMTFEECGSLEDFF